MEAPPMVKVLIENYNTHRIISVTSNVTCRSPGQEIT